MLRIHPAPARPPGRWLDPLPHDTCRQRRGLSCGVIRSELLERRAEKIQPLERNESLPQVLVSLLEQIRRAGEKLPAKWESQQRFGERW